MVKLDEWWRISTSNGKLDFSAPLFNVDVDTKSSPPILRSIQFGLLLKSTASFPLQFRVDLIHSDFMGRIPVHKKHDGNTIDIPAGGEGWYRDHPIPLAIEMPHGFQDGNLRFRLSYWRNPKKLNVIERDYQVNSIFNDDRSITFTLHQQ